MTYIKHLILSTTLLLLTVTLHAQTAAELDKRNGFKDIKMVSDVTQYEGLEFQKEIDDKQFKKLSLYTPKKGHYETIGGIPIIELEVTAYKDEVYKIHVVIGKNTKLYSGMKKAFGEPEFSIRSNYYFWATDNLKLTYQSHSKNKLELLYQSFIIEEKLKQEKKDEIENISEDF